MKVAWIHDHYFYTDGHKYYSRGSMPSYAWDRYLINGAELHIFGREMKTQSVILSSADKVHFHLSKYYTSIGSFVRNFSKIKKELTDFILANDKIIIRLPSVLGLLACSIVKKYHIPYMIEVVGSAYDSFHSYGNLSGKILARPYEHLVANAVKNSIFTLYVTQNYLQQEYPNSKGYTTACTNAMIEDVDDSVLSNRMCKIDGYNKTRPFVIGQVGNLSIAYKGYDVALKAVSILKDRGLSVEYRLGGNGNPQSIIQMAEKLGVKDCVSIVGPIKHELIHEFYDSIDCYVHPSLLEGLPRVCVEAISRGCPCAPSNVGGTSELVDNELLHEAGDYQKLADDIYRIANDKDYAKHIATSNFKRAENYYSSLINQKRKDFLLQFYEYQQ